MQVTVNGHIVDVPELEVVRLVASSKGFDDVDVEPTPGSVSITATGPNGLREKTTGATVAKAAQAFFKVFGLGA